MVSTSVSSSNKPPRSLSTRPQKVCGFQRRPRPSTATSRVPAKERGVDAKSAIGDKYIVNVDGGDNADEKKICK